MSHPRGPSQHNFALVPHAEIQRSSFDRSHGCKTTMNAGDLVPIFCDEVLPGDTFNLRLNAFARLATPIKPFMDNLYFDTFFFFVPNRLVWTHWVNFNGEQTNPGDSTAYTIPQQVSPSGGYAIGSLQDYFGLPTVGQMTATTKSHSALPLRAYNLIWNQWFRDENLQNSVTVDTGDGPDNIANYVLSQTWQTPRLFHVRTSLASKGCFCFYPSGFYCPCSWHRCSSGTAVNTTFFGTTAAGDQTNQPGWSSSTNQIILKAQSNAAVGTGNRPQVFADLTTASAATINQLRQAFQIQKCMSAMRVVALVTLKLFVLTSVLFLRTLVFSVQNILGVDQPPLMLIPLLKRLALVLPARLRRKAPRCYGYSPCFWARIR